MSHSIGATAPPKPFRSTMTAEQQKAVDQIVTFSQSDQLGHLLDGGAGVGKTFTLAAVADRLEADGFSVTLTAPTHKAAEVLAEKTDREVVTIHSLLGLRPQSVNGVESLKQVGTVSFPPKSILIIDECSMIDDALLGFIKKALVTFKAKVLFVGDRYQLPPVTGRSVVYHLTSIGKSELTTVMRQAAGNPIIQQATGWREYMQAGLEGPEPGLQQELNVLGEGIELVGRAAFEAAMVRTFKADPEQAKVLGFTNGCAARYNNLLRPVVLGQAAGFADIIPGEWLVANAAVIQGDRFILANNQTVQVETSNRVQHGSGLWGYSIITTENHRLFVAENYDEAKRMLNNLASVARALQRQCNAGETKLDAERRKAWREFYALKESLADLRPPYAQTVHKAQGSTYRTTFLDMADIARCTAHSTRARLIYTALTRASHKVIACMGAR